jgi:hypothetical protein
MRDNVTAGGLTIKEQVIGEVISLRETFALSDMLTRSTLSD